MSFDLSEYVDVPARIRIFKAEFNEGILQSEITFVDGGVLCKAYAYRFELDTRPGIGHAFEPIPGKTSYTKDSEVMNAETSAWGRAIAALGFDFKKIASAEEVRNRSAGEATGPVSEPAASPAEPNPVEKAQAAAEAAKAARAPTDDGQPQNVVLEFGKYKGNTLEQVDTLNPGYIDGFLLNPEKFQPKDEHKRRVLEAAKILRGQSDLVPADDPYADIPFAPVPV